LASQTKKESSALKYELPPLSARPASAHGFAYCPEEATFDFYISAYPILLLLMIKYPTGTPRQMLRPSQHLVLVASIAGEEASHHIT